MHRVVALAPVCDLREAIRLGLGDGATPAFLDGADPAAADPMMLFADRPDAEVEIVHGVDDVDVPSRSAADWWQRTRGSGCTRSPAVTWS